MTWSFVYLACLLLGLVVAVVTGLVRHLPFLTQRHPVTQPSPEHFFPFLGVVGQRLSVGLAVLGVAGLALGRVPDLDRLTVLLLAVAAAVVASLLATLLLRRPCPPMRSSHATVLREIPPGGYGQVQVDQGGRMLTMAAKSVDSRVIPAGAVVEVLDCDSSVLSVRLRP